MRITTFLCTLLLAIAVTPTAAQIEFGAGERQLLGNEVNSPEVEILPIVSADGATLYFDRKYHEGNTGGVNDQDDIWFSTRLNDSTWSPARNIGPPLNSPGSDVLFWIAPDGATALLFHGGRDLSAPMGMALARRTATGWGTPQRITIDGVISFGESYYAFITPDQKHLLLAYAADLSKPRDLDLYVCRAASSDLTRWGPPVSLGSVVNTAGFEGAPFIAPDGRTLYFTSDGRPGVGSADLFVTRRLDTGWTSWSQPDNLAGNVNTPRFEASLSIPASGTEIYVSGGAVPGEPSFGTSDIYRIPLPKRHRPDPVVLVDGTLLAGDRGIRGLVRAERAGDGREVATTASDDRGRFHLSLPPGVAYRFTGGADGYSEGTAELAAIPGDSTLARVTIRLERGEVTPLSAPGIRFAFGSADLLPESSTALTTALSAINATTSLRAILVVGHTDDIGEDAANLELSRLRATAVRDWLVSQGVPPARLQVEARGETRPIASNATEAGRAANRRVEFLFPVER